MKKIYKITTLIVMEAFTLFFMICTAFEVNAGTPVIYYSDVWNGDNLATIEVNNISSERLKEVTYKGEVIDESNYSIADQNNSAVITFKQEYLQMLNLQNGSNTFWAEFKGIKALPLQGFVLEDGKNEVSIKRTLNQEISKLTLSKSSFQEEDVDESNYTITTTEDSFIITFDEAYLNGLTDIKAFMIYSIQNTNVVMELIKGQLGDVDSSGTIDLADARETLKMALKIKGISGVGLKLSDVDNDNQVTLADAQTILKKALKIEK